MQPQPPEYPQHTLHLLGYQNRAKVAWGAKARLRLLAKRRFLSPDGGKRTGQTGKQPLPPPPALSLGRAPGAGAPTEEGVRATKHRLQIQFWLLMLPSQENFSSLFARLLPLLLLRLSLLSHHSQVNEELEPEENRRKSNSTLSMLWRSSREEPKEGQKIKWTQVIRTRKERTLALLRVEPAIWDGRLDKPGGCDGGRGGRGCGGCDGACGGCGGRFCSDLCVA